LFTIGARCSDGQGWLAFVCRRVAKGIVAAVVVVLAGLETGVARRVANIWMAGAVDRNTRAIAVTLEGAQSRSGAAAVATERFKEGIGTALAVAITKAVRPTGIGVAGILRAIVVRIGIDRNVAALAVDTRTFNCGCTRLAIAITCRVAAHPIRTVTALTLLVSRTSVAVG